MGSSLPPDAYWGGFTATGVLMRLAVASKNGTARSACGRALDGGAWVIPGPLQHARCQTCADIEENDHG